MRIITLHLASYAMALALGWFGTGFLLANAPADAAPVAEVGGR